MRLFAIGVMIRSMERAPIAGQFLHVIVDRLPQVLTRNACLVAEDQVVREASQFLEIRGTVWACASSRHRRSFSW